MDAARRERGVRVADEQLPGRIKPVATRHRPARLLMLTRRKWPARFAINENLDPRPIMRPGHPHVIGGTLVAKWRGHRLMHRKAPVVREGQPQLRQRARPRSEEHTSELQSLMRISYAVFCLKKKQNTQHPTYTHENPLAQQTSQEH